MTKTELIEVLDEYKMGLLSKAKTEEERHFYITLYVKENYSARELSRQIDSGYYERYMLFKEKTIKLIYYFSIEGYSVLWHLS